MKRISKNKKWFSLISLILSIVLFSSACTLGNDNVTTGEDLDSSDFEQEKTIEPDDLPLVVDGESEYVIVIGAQCTVSEETAGYTLSSVFQTLAGVSVPVVTDETPAAAKEIIVGHTNRPLASEVSDEELGDEGFAIWIEEDTLVIIGGGQRGTLYGVYSFLEDVVGCYRFTSHIRTYPEEKDVIIDRNLKITEQPLFEYRQMLWATVNNASFQAWNKLNPTSNGEKYGGGIDITPFVHTFEQLVDPNLYFEEHPEYFSLQENWGRRPDRQLCLSNPEVLKIAITTVRSWLEENPNISIVSVSQNDNPYPCVCDECNKIYEIEGSYSGSILRFVNAIAEDIEKDYPNVAIETLAYQYSRKAPKVTVPKENVIIRLCTIECCFSHALYECDYENVNHRGFAEVDHSFDQDLEDWGKICDRIYIWDYTMNFTHYMQTFPNFSSLQKNLQYFSENGVVGYFAQGDWHNVINCEFGNLRVYLLTKLLWNPYCDLDYYRELFMKAYYGDAWEYVDRYLRLTEEQAQNHHFGCYSLPEEVVVYTEEQLWQCTQWWDAAEAAVAHQSEILKNVKRSRISFDYYLVANDLVPHTTEEEMVKIREEFFLYTKRMGLKRYHESREPDEIPPYHIPMSEW